jgi:hypothetical protein
MGQRKRTSGGLYEFKTKKPHHMNHSHDGFGGQVRGEKPENRTCQGRSGVLI